MDIFNKERVAGLELEVNRLKNESYKVYSENVALRNKVSDLELKVKCLQMWCDDDEAIDELIAAVKEKDKATNDNGILGPRYDARAWQHQAAQAHQLAAQAQQSTLAGRGTGGLGASGGILGMGY